MATTMHDVEVWVMVNAEGEYGAGTNEEAAVEDFEQNCSTDGGRRLVKITLKVPLPETIEVSGEVTVTEEASELKAV